MNPGVFAAILAGTGVSIITGFIVTSPRIRKSERIAAGALAGLLLAAVALVAIYYPNGVAG